MPVVRQFCIGDGPAPRKTGLSDEIHMEAKSATHSCGFTTEVVARLILYIELGHQCQPMADQNRVHQICAVQFGHTGRIGKPRRTM